MVTNLKGIFGQEDKDLLRAFAIFCGTTIGEGKAKDKDVSLANDVAFFSNMAVPQDELALLKTPEFDVHKTASEPETADLLIPFIFGMFEDLGLLEKFRIPHTILYQFLISVRSKYRNEVPYPTTYATFLYYLLYYVRYHNFTHAFDVAQTVYCYITQGKLQEMLLDLDIFVLLVSALCHDLDHMGVNNAFHSKVWRHHSCYASTYPKLRRKHP